MPTSSPDPSIAQAIADSLAGRRLLDHPYYRAWQEGRLTAADIRSYAGQYRHFERVLPEVLIRAADGMVDDEARGLVEQNLADELATPSHLELFDRFAEAVGSTDRPPASDATGHLVALYRQAAASGAGPAMSVVAAYEVQAAEIAATKGAALRRHLGIGSEGTRFWDVHAAIETDHAEWTVEALGRLGREPAEVSAWASRSAEAWWAFLDEREADRAGATA